MRPPTSHGRQGSSSGRKPPPGPAPSAPRRTAERVCAMVAASGRLAVCDVAELNPALDVDDRTARAGARLLHRILDTTPPAA
ncbi:arginase family protein [Streptomyces sp. NPDC015127]|uniref:arginase family protein n=1 Tax=Streptomyces sp. NPDC015127 TaxID=3364939 RepID=UPI0036FC2F9A